MESSKNYNQSPDIVLHHSNSLVSCLKCYQQNQTSPLKYCCSCGYRFCSTHFMRTCDQPKCPKWTCGICMKLFGQRAGWGGGLEYCPDCSQN